MVVVSPHLSSGQPCGEGDLSQGFNAFAAVVERSSHPGWMLPEFALGHHSGQSEFELPWILVSDEPRDAFFQLADSIEETPWEPWLRCVFDDPGAESTESKERAGAWTKVVAARFAELLALRFDWNGHGASPISSANIIKAGGFLAAVMEPSTPAPTIVPTAGGGLQLEWHRAGLDVELLYGEEDPPLLYVAEIGSGREWEGPPVEGFAEFELAQRLIG